HRGDLHFLVDAAGAYIERTAKNEREAEHVVDLVRVVATAGGDDDVVAGGVGHFRLDLGVGVRAGENDGLRRHRLQHFYAHQVGAGEADEYIGALQGIGQRTRAGVVEELFLVLVQAFAAGVDHAAAVDHVQIAFLCAQAHQQAHAGDGGGTGAETDDLRLGQRLALDLQCVEHARRGDDGGAVLVVVEYRDVALLDQRLLDLEALGRLDVF